MWPFRRKQLLDDEVVDWTFDHVQWLLEHHASRAAFSVSVPQPISDRPFAAADLSGHALALRLLERVLVLSSMEHLTIRLRADDSSGRFADAGGIAPAPRMTAAGLYRAAGSRIEISYDSALLERPAELVAVLAHEVAHAVLDQGAGKPPPGDAEEMLTDLTGTFLGFGFYLLLFRSDTRVASPEIAVEWREMFEAYMSLRELTFATALHATLAGTDRSTVLRHAGHAVGREAREHLKRAFGDLDRLQPRVEVLRSARAEAAALGAARDRAP